MDCIEAVETGKRNLPLKQSSIPKTKQNASTKAEFKTAQMITDDVDNDNNDTIIAENESELD